MADGSGSESFSAGFASVQHLQRFVLGVACVATIIAIAAIVTSYFANVKFSGGSVSVSIETKSLEGGKIKEIAVQKTGLRITMENGLTISDVIVPGNQLWVDTGIDVEPGQIVHIAASGSIDLDERTHIDLLNNPTSQGQQKFSHLVDPYGKWINGSFHPDNKQNENPASELRNLIKLKPDAALGMLVGTIVANESDLRTNPRASRVFTIQEAGANAGDRGYTYQGDTAGRLFLAANDLVWDAGDAARDAFLYRLAKDGRRLSDSERMQRMIEAYRTIAPTAAGVAKKTAELQARWEAMRAERFFEGFYEDNSGQYMVSVAVSPPG